MFQIEKRITEWLQKHMILWGFIGITALSLIIRWSFRDMVSGDAYSFLLPWYDTAKGLGFNALANQIGDYNIIYQFIIVIFTKLPIKPLYCYKIFSVIFDYILAVTIGYLVSQISSKHSKLIFWAGYSITILCPTVFLNSSCWAQCDVIFTTFIVLALLMLSKEKYTAMFIFYGLAFSFKFQAIFLLPFFLLLYFMTKKFTILNFLIIPLVMITSSIPGIIHGRSFTDVFSIYLSQSNTYQFLQGNYPTFWCLIGNSGIAGNDIFFMFKHVAMFFTVAVLLAQFVYLIYNNIHMNFRNLIYIAFLSCYTCVFFLPVMHERYSFPYEILGIIVLFYNRKTIFSWIGLIILACFTYGNYLFGLGVTINYIPAFLNLCIYISYVLLLNYEMIKERSYSESLEV